MTRILLAFAAVALAVLAVAVARELRAGPGTVRGRVTVGGEPVAAGSVLVESDAVRWATVAIVSPDGGYVVTGVPPGPVRVGVRTRRVVRFDGVPPGRAAEAPPRYENPAGSGLGFTVVPGEQTHNLDLPAE